MKNALRLLPRLQSMRSPLSYGCRFSRRICSPCTTPSPNMARSYATQPVLSEAERIALALKPKEEPVKNPIWILWIFPVAAFGLGVWQVYRRDVKERFISEKEAQLRLDPMSLPKDLEVDVELFKDRRVQVTGRYQYDKEILLGPRTHDGKGGYIVITPFKLSDGSGTIMVGRGWIPTSMKKKEARQEINKNDDEVTIQGIIKGNSLPNSWTPANQPDLALFYSIDVNQMASVTGTKPVLVDIVYDPKAKPKLEIPIPKAMGVEVWNHHLEYSLIWFGLAGATATMIMLYKRGKIGFHDVQVKGMRRF